MRGRSRATPSRARRVAAHRGSAGEHVGGSPHADDAALRAPGYAVWMDVDVARIRDQVFFEGPERGRRLSRFWTLLLLAAVIASAGVVSNSTATVIGAMIVAPLMTPILGTVVAVVLADAPNLWRCGLLVVAGAATVVALSWLLGHLVPF